MIKTTNYLIIFLILLSSCSYKVQTKIIVLKDNNNQPYTKIVKLVRSNFNDFHNQTPIIISFATVKEDEIQSIRNKNEKYSNCTFKDSNLTIEKNKKKLKWYDIVEAIFLYIFGLILVGLFYLILFISTQISFLDMIHDKGDLKLIIISLLLASLYTIWLINYIMRHK